MTPNLTLDEFPPVSTEQWNEVVRADMKGTAPKVKLFYRAGSKGKFEEVEANVEDGDVKASIPPDSVKPPIVEYYLLGVDKGGLPIVSRGDAGAPLRIAVPGGVAAWVIPVAIGGGVLVAAAGIVGGIFLFHKGSTGTGPGQGSPPTTSVSVSIGQ